jgi:hypothetical protein
MGYFFSILILVIVLLIISIYKKNSIKELNDKEILKNMETGFVEAVIEESVDILKKREDEAIEDIFPKDKTPSDNKKVLDTNRKFYENDINWKFTDVNSNLDCWKNWDYVRRVENNDDIIINKNIIKTLKRADGRTWCAVSRATGENEKREFSKPPTTMDKINQYTGNVWGLVGAVGLGLTEELIMKAMKKSTMESMEKMAKKASQEASEKIMNKLSKEFYEETGEKLFKEGGEKITKESLEKASRESLEKLSKEAEEKALTRLNNNMKNKLNSKFLQETKERIARELKNNLLDKYSKKTISSLKDDIVKKLGQALSGKTTAINAKLLGEALKSKLYVGVKEMSLKSMAKALNASVQKNILTKSGMQIQKSISISIYKNIMKGAASSVSSYVSRKLARVVLMKALLKAQIIITTKAFFRSQAKAFLNIGKDFIKNIDDIAKMAKQLASLTKTMTKEAIKIGVKSGIKTFAKLASKLKPGPLAIFDILSFALDTIDPMNYNAFMPTKKYIEAVDKSNKDRKDIILNLKKDLPQYKDIAEANIPYPTVMDPLDQLKVSDLEGSINKKIGQLFALSSMGETHKSLKAYIDKMNTDLANGTLTSEELVREDPNEESDHNKKMNSYFNLIDVDAVLSVVNIDNCRKLGGVVYDEDKCTYKKEACDKLYKWPLDNKETEERKEEVYAEFVTDSNGVGKCMEGNPEIRSICETMDASWDVKTNSCELGATYCLKKGGTWDTNTKECTIPDAQQIFEFILGTTVTRLGATTVNAAKIVTKGALDLFLEGCGYDGEIKIRDKCADIGNDLSKGNKLKILDCNNGAGQKFYYNPDDYTIRPMSDYNKCLDIPNNNVIPGAEIQLWDCNGGNAQKFLYDENYKELTPFHSNDLCINLPNDNNANNTKFQLDYCKDHQSQRFTLARDNITDMGVNCTVGGDRAADCPSGYTNDGFFCGRGRYSYKSESARWADCPDGYTNNGANCGKGGDSYETGFARAADCPDGYTNMGATCYRGPDTDELDAGSLASCPPGYMNGGLLGCIFKSFKTPTEQWYSKAGVTSDTDKKNCEKDWGVGNCEQTGAKGSILTLRKCSLQAKDKGYKYADKWTADYATLYCSPESGYREFKFSTDGVCSGDTWLHSTLGRCYKNCKQGYHSTGFSCYRDPDSLGMDSMTCGDGEFRDAGLCYKNCIPGYTQTGLQCDKAPDSLGMSSMTCSDGEFRNAGLCYKNCMPGYTQTGIECVREASTLGAGSMTCKPWERKIGVRCYTAMMPGYDDALLGQTRFKETKNVLHELLKNKKFNRFKNNIKRIGDDFKNSFPK